MPVTLSRASAERLLMHQLGGRRHYYWFPDSPKIVLDNHAVTRKFKQYWSHECSLEDLSLFLGFSQVDEIKQDARYIKFLLPKDRVD